MADDEGWVALSVACAVCGGCRVRCCAYVVLDGFGGALFLAVVRGVSLLWGLCCCYTLYGVWWCVRRFVLLRLLRVVIELAD